MLQTAPVLDPQYSQEARSNWVESGIILFLDQYWQGHTQDSNFACKQQYHQPTNPYCQKKAIMRSPQSKLDSLPQMGLIPTELFRNSNLNWRSSENYTYVLTVNMVYNFKICIIGCDDNLIVDNFTRFNTAYKLISHSTPFSHGFLFEKGRQ